MNEQLNNLLTAIRAEGFPVILNWEAPRWSGDKGSARHYTIADDGSGRMPAFRNFTVTCYERGDGYALFAETPTNRIADDVALLLNGGADPLRDALRKLRAEVRDWQEALSGEREGLDELCAEVDTLLGETGDTPFGEIQSTPLLGETGAADDFEANPELYDAKAAEMTPRDGASR